MAKSEINDNTFQRLVTKETLSSQARKAATVVASFSRRWPDSLDLALSSTYDHHAVWGAGRANVLKQPKACVEDHTPDYKKILAEEFSVEGKERMCPTEATAEYRNAPFHLQLGVSPHHTSNSRRGYGRCPDGCFFST